MSNDYDWKIVDLLRHSLLIAEAERDDALWEIGLIDKKIRGCGGKWYAAVCYASAICERALAGSKRIKEDE